MLKYYEPDQEVKMGGILNPSKDLGTPISSTESNASEKSVTLCIDGHTFSVPAGTSIMRAAAINDINIPKLCATDSLEPSVLAESAWYKFRKEGFSCILHDTRRGRDDCEDSG